MAEDCVCTNLASIYTMQSDLFNKMVSKQNAIAINLSSINARLNELNTNLISLFGNLDTDLQGIKDNLILVKNSIDNKEMCVSNETIVESPLSTFVSKAKLDVDE